MNRFPVYAANASLVLVLAYAFLTVLFIYYFKAPAFGVAYCLATASVIFFVGLVFKIPKRYSFELKLSFALVASCGLSLIGQYLTQKEYFDYFGRSGHSFSTAVFVMNTLWIFSGMAVARCSFGRSNLLAIGILLPVGYLISQNLGEGLLVSYADIADEGFEGVNHLLVAEMVMLIGYFAFSVSYGFMRIPVLLLIGIFAFAGGGRSSFYFGLIVPILYELRWGERRNQVLIYLGSAVVFVVISVLVVDGSNDQIQRMFFASGVTEDLSYAERSAYFSEGFPALIEQVPIGDPGWIVRTYGTAGAYIHNIFSAWQFYGFISFLTLLGVLVVVARRLFSCGLDFRSPACMFGVLCFAYALIGIVFSKFVGFSFLWFSIGFWVFRLNSIKGARVLGLSGK